MFIPIKKDQEIVYITWHDKGFFARNITQWDNLHRMESFKSMINSYHITNKIYSRDMGNRDMCIY